jgi:hypothetical protein
VLKPTPGQANKGHARVVRADSFLQEAIGQLKGDNRGEIVKVKPSTDPGAPQSEATRIRIGHELSAQDAPDHRSPAGPGITPRLHGSLVHRRILSGKVELLANADMMNERSLRQG